MEHAIKYQKWSFGIGKRCEIKSEFFFLNYRTNLKAVIYISTKFSCFIKKKQEDNSVTNI